MEFLTSPLLTNILLAAVVVSLYFVCRLLNVLCDWVERLSGQVDFLRVNAGESIEISKQIRNEARWAKMEAHPVGPDEDDG